MTREEAQAVAILVATALDTNGQARELLTLAENRAGKYRQLTTRQRWVLVSVARQARHALDEVGLVLGSGS